jgi:hypothetical protein
MNAIIPLNIAAIRVNNNDANAIVSQFKGRTALFEDMPYKKTDKVASTGDAIYRPLEQPAYQALDQGVHLHWELPDYYRRGVQPANATQPGGSGAVEFPHTPNRWLIVRYFSLLNNTSGVYEAPVAAAFLIESDYVTPQKPSDAIRVSVPVPANADPGTQPYQYMGRILSYQAWNPATEKPSEFLTGYKGPNDQQLYLTSIGFVGPSFASYYPECNSVFGFRDNFKDIDGGAVWKAISENDSLQFKVSYQVIGWVNETVHDPLLGIDVNVIRKYDDYARRQNELKLPLEMTPPEVFQSEVDQISNKSWKFNLSDIPYQLNDHGLIDSLTVPTGTLCNGLIQEVVWNMRVDMGSTYFLANPDVPGKPSGLWKDTVKVAVGNSTPEALSALLKLDMHNENHDPDVLKNFEFLLDALQMGMLRDLENQDDKIIYLDESLHAKAFSTLSGGQLWLVRSKEQPGAKSAKDVPQLPLDLGEKLFLLNQAQKNYDQGRAALDILRKQLFMDWLRYVKMYVAKKSEPWLTWEKIQSFLTIAGGTGELGAVQAAGSATGIVTYQLDKETGQVTGIDPLPKGVALANILFEKFDEMRKALDLFPQYELMGSPAPAFYLPTEPVVLVEGDRIEPERRNGGEGKLAARVSTEIVGSLTILYNDVDFPIPVSKLAGLPVVTPVTPMQSDVQALIGEAYLMVPMLATVFANALKTSGAGNPAEQNYDKFVLSLQAAQGGLSPLEDVPSAGLYAAIREPGYKPGPDPKQPITSPMELTVTFNGWAPDPVGWNAQSRIPGFPSKRVDPFLPVFLQWSVGLRPLNWKDAPEGVMNYSPDNLTSYFQLDADAVDYQYDMKDGVAVDFAAQYPVKYSSSTVLSKRPVSSLTGQIDTYVKTYPVDPADATLETVKEYYQRRQIMSQAISEFGVQQTLRQYIPQITVQDLPLWVQDEVTAAIHSAAIASKTDNWYTWAFNSVAPISSTELAHSNFGPLRSGFLQIQSLKILDTFGQVMELGTATTNPDGSLKAIPCINMQPRAGDLANKDWIYLAPRVLSPTRLWFRWLSAAHNNQVGGVRSDFVEMNSHPATTPVCGWILPNHLDRSLFFYGANGEAIGSFGIEAAVLKYRTRAGNTENNDDSLEKDIGPERHPTKNPHLANFMWYIHGTKSAGFLEDLMDTIEKSDTFINPSSYAQDASLAVLIGRPLALTRSIVAMETAGNLLPLNQADVSLDSPFPQDVRNDRVKYLEQRQEASSAKLGGVTLPLRMGDLASLDDGLVGFLIDGSPSDPYSIFYSSAAPDNGQHGVVKPKPDTLTLTLNAPSIALTMLVDPRAAVHVTTGILPTAELAIPSDQYSEALGSLAMTFFTNPVLKERQELVVPVPRHEGYEWNWINASGPPPVPLQPNASNEFAVYDYTPQTALEGWLQLKPVPKKPDSEEVEK